MEFNQLQIQEGLAKALAEQSFKEMTKIQEQAIPVLLEGKDVVGKSQTGTGKTFAFAIPAIEKIDPILKKPQVLVLLPTRELALQVADEFRKLLKYLPDIRTASVFGGAPMDNQIRAIKAGAQIVVGTPGRIMDHMRRKTLKLDDLKVVVLDEADEMLNMGFREDIEWILDHTDHKPQIVLFSATMPEAIRRIARTYQQQPVSVEIEAKYLVAPGIEQKYYSISDKDRYEALSRLIDAYKPKRSLIFCNTKAEVDELTRRLQKSGHPVDKIHGDMPQSARLKVLDRFSKGQLSILIATDVAARGIDVNDVDIVFNYDVPDNEEYYVHRIGRTGRAGKSGLALTLTGARDEYRLNRIKRYTKKDIEKDLVPTGEMINELKIEHFKERFRKHSDGDLERYYNIVKEMKDKGYAPETIAAVLLRRLLPLEDQGDINVKRQPRTSAPSKNRSDRFNKNRSKSRASSSFSKSSKKKKKDFKAGGASKGRKR